MPIWSKFVTNRFNYEPIATPTFSKITHHSLTISWSPPTGLKIVANERILYQVEITEFGSGTDTSTEPQVIYQGYAEYFEYDGLKPGNNYSVKICYKYCKEIGPWTEPCMVELKALPHTGQDLHKSINNWNEEQLQEILESGSITVDIPNKEGLSPLMHAAKKGYVNIAKILLQHGADANFLSEGGKSALTVACTHGHLEMIELMAAHQLNWNHADKAGLYPIHHVLSSEKIDAIDYFVKKGVSVDQAESFTQWTPLMRACVMGINPSIVKFLLRNNAKLDLRDCEGKTALMLAVINSRDQIVEDLLQWGSDPFLTNKYGKNAIDFAKTFSGEGHVAKSVKILRLLENFKAIQSAKNST